uniref:Cell division control protein 42 homolog n=1 Tax=Schistosoma japonicum TaxID=6182 RepID=C1LE76_SCHJA|nr:Cell division control protein 42 homolog precursor [Schistosoma japonicum]
MKPIDGGFSPELPHLKKVRPQNTHGHNINNENPTIVKCILIGDEQVGKTSLVVSYTSNGYPDEYKPSALDTYCVEVCADSRPVHLQICDAGGKTLSDL